MKSNRIKKVINEEITRFLIESVDVMIDNFPYQQSLDTVGDISNYLINKIHYDYLPKNLSGDELTKARKSLMYDDIVPDGNDYFEKDGTINIYLNPDFPMQLYDNMMSYFKYILKEKNITLSKPRIENSGTRDSQVIRLPIIMNKNQDTKNNPPELNLANGNARMIFSDVLNYGSEYSGEGSSFDAADLLIKINTAENLLLGYPDKTTRDTSTPKNMYSDIKGKDYILPVLKRIKEIAQWALDKGYRTIYVA